MIPCGCCVTRSWKTLVLERCNEREVTENPTSEIGEPQLLSCEANVSHNLDDLGGVSFLLAPPLDEHALNLDDLAHLEVSHVSVDVGAASSPVAMHLSLHLQCKPLAAILSLAF